MYTTIHTGHGGASGQSGFCRGRNSVSIQNNRMMAATPVARPGGAMLQNLVCRAAGKPLGALVSVMVAGDEKFDSVGIDLVNKAVLGR